MQTFKHNAELLIQEIYVIFDIRTFVVDNKIFASTKRIQEIQTSEQIFIDKKYHIN